MRKTAYALLLLGAGASVALAEPAAGTLPMTMLGSDTLRQVTVDVINACLLENSISYLGTGSTNGGNAMRAKNQQIAPQSRFLNDAECNDFGSSPQLGQGVTIGLDGIGVFGDATEPTTCSTLRFSGSLTVSDRNGVAGVQCPGCSGNVYTFSDWRDVLRIVYAGQGRHVTSDPCSDADPTRVPLAVTAGTPPAGCGDGVLAASEQCDDGNTLNNDGCSSSCSWEIASENRCNSDLRHELVSTWGNLFEGGCSDPECSSLRHAFRRDDLSGTTDTFLTLLGLPAATSRTFCNGFGVEDLDPIRRPCDPNEQACASVPYANRGFNPNGGAPTGTATNPAARGGDLGLVQAIDMPANSEFHFGAACTFGKFAYAPMPAAGSLQAQRCPDGNGRSAARCKYPYSGNSPPPIGKFNCLANMNTVPSPRVFSNMDGRSYNLTARDADSGALLTVMSGINDPRWGGGAVYRLHQTTPLSGGATSCQEPDATQQIGCLVQASPCSLGFAGAEAEFAGNFNGTHSLLLGSPITPSQPIALLGPNVRRLLDASGPSNGTCGNGDGDNFGLRYPLSRRLWINASRGFGNSAFANIFNRVDSNDPDTSPDLDSMEHELVRCMADRTTTDQAIVENGFFTLTPTNCTSGSCNQFDLALGYRTRSCQPRCGDGFVQSGEQCDDGNLVNGDGCSASCTVP